MSDKNHDDFSDYMLEETGTLDLVLPSGDAMLYNGQPVQAVIYSPASASYRAAEQARDRFVIANVKAGKAGDQMEQNREQHMTFLTAITKEIRNFPFSGGPAAIYREPRLQYIASQVEAYASRLGNFFKGGKSS